MTRSTHSDGAPLADIRPPEAGWRDLPADPHDAVTLENDVLGARLWGPPHRPTLSLGKSDLWDRRWRGDQQPPVPLSRIRELAESGRLEEIARSANDTIYSPAYRYDFPCPKPGGQPILGLDFAERARIAADGEGGWWLRAEGRGKRLDARVWVPLTRVAAVVELYPCDVEADDLWVRVHRHADTILPGQPVDPTLGGKPAPGHFEAMASPRCCGVAQDAGDRHEAREASGAEGARSSEVPSAVTTPFGIAQDFPAEGTFPQGFCAALLAAVPAAVAVEEREGELGLGTPLWAPEEGRLSHGVVKRYRPINESPGAAATAHLEAGPVPDLLVATIQTTQDDDAPEAAACRVLGEAVDLGVAGLRREQREALDEAHRPHPARAAVRESAAPGVPHGDAQRQGAPRSGQQESGQQAAGAVAPDARDPGAGAPAPKGATTVLEASARIVPPLRRPGGYYGDVPLCSVGPTRLWFQDAALWHNDFHLNEIRATPLLTMGRFEEVRAYADMIHTLLPQARENARDAYGLPGAMYPLVHFPLRCRGVAHTNLTWELDLGLNGLVAKPLWLYYRYTGDQAFLGDLAYPVLAEGARFCAAYLSAGEDGRLHIEPTVSPEHWGITEGFERNRDCTSALTLTRYLLRAAARAARLLERDAEEADAWDEKAGRLAPYPTWDSPTGPVWVDVAGAPPIEYNIPVPLSPLFWGDDVGLDSDPQVLELARRTLRQIDVWQPHSFYLDRHVGPRLGRPPESGPVGPENLLLSYQSIRLFPAVPSGAEADMENLRAEGGFRVSARRGADGVIGDVRLHSELGEPCRLAHPWPGRRVEVRAAATGDLVGEAGVEESHVSFYTGAGVDYAVQPLTA